MLFSEDELVIATQTGQAMVFQDLQLYAQQLGIYTTVNLEQLTLDFKALPFNGLPAYFCTAAMMLFTIYDISVCSCIGKGSQNPQPNLEPHIARGCKNLK